MSKPKLYISSTFCDLEDTRAFIRTKINDHLQDFFEFTEIMENMKGENGRNEPDIDTCLNNVRKADVYILIIGKRYGSCPQGRTDQKSYTHLEYEAACVTRASKRLLIYKIELTDDFFNQPGLLINNIPDEDEQTREKYSLFKKGLNIPADNVINDLAKFDRKINNIIAKAHFLITATVNLKVSEYRKDAIDRNEQKRKLEDDNIGRQSKVVTFLISTKGEEDAYDRFSYRLRNTLTQDDVQKTIQHPDIAQIFSSSIFTGDPEKEKKYLQEILYKSSFNILGQKAPGVTFENLYKQIEQYRIQNRVLGFTIRSSSHQIILDSLQLIKLFVKELNDYLVKNGFVFNFFIPIYLIDDDSLGNPIDENVFSGFSESFYKLGKLTNVECADAQDWFDELVNENKVVFEADNEKDELFNLIFLDRNSFPQSYKKCLYLIETRIKN
ncbi:MAG: DUF4062 domain-containing protein [Bacteroidota bacterium]